MTDDEMTLIDGFRRCDEAGRRELLSRAQALAGHRTKDMAGDSLPAEPRALAPSSGAETVIMAIRRLRQTYPGADRRKLFGVTSTLLSAHVLEGRAAAEVIAEMEQAFIRLSAAAGTKSGGPHA